MNFANPERTPVNLFYRAEATLPAGAQLTPKSIAQPSQQQQHPYANGSVRPFNERGEEATRLK